MGRLRGEDRRRGAAMAGSRAADGGLLEPLALPLAVAARQAAAMDEQALLTELHAHYRLVPAGRDSKVSLTRWNEREWSLGEILHHRGRGGNVALKVGATKTGPPVV